MEVLWEVLWETRGKGHGLRLENESGTTGMIPGRRRPVWTWHPGDGECEMSSWRRGPWLWPHGGGDGGAGNDLVGAEVMARPNPGPGLRVLGVGAPDSRCWGSEFSELGPRVLGVLGWSSIPRPLIFSYFSMGAEFFWNLFFVQKKFNEKLYTHAKPEK